MQKHIYLLFIILITKTATIFSQSPWPGEAWQNSVNLTSLASEFQANLSGAHWNPITRRLWVCVNGPGSFCALKENGKGSFMIDSAGGKPAKWTYNGDLESITQAELNDNTVFLLDETNGKILEFDISKGQDSKLIHSWNINPDIPVYAGLLGPEGIAFIPDEWLMYNGFTDKDGLAYTSKNGMGGIMLVAHQNGGNIYAFDLNRSNDTYKFIGKYATNRTESSGLEFDRSTGKLYIWHSPYNNYIEVTEMKSVVNGSSRKFIMQIEFNGPKVGNLEGIAMTPASTNENWYFAADDSNQDGYALMWFKNFKPCLPEPFFVADTIDVCAGDTITLTNTTIGDCGIETYSWTTGEGGSPEILSGYGPHKVVYSSSGLKTIKLFVNGNIKDSLIKTDFINVNALPDIPVINLISDTLFSSSASSNRWYFNDTLINAYEASFYKVAKSGEYKVEVVNPSGCKAMSDSLYVDIARIADKAFILTNKISVLQNKNGLTIVLNDDYFSQCSTNIFNLTGDCVFSQQTKSNQNIQCSNLNDGIYIIKIQSAKGTFVRKLIILKD